MTVQGFNQDYYLGVKLAQLQSTSPEWVGKTTADLQNTLAKAGLTPAMHYEMYGYKEGLAPNSSFNEAEYKLAKATQMFNAGQAMSIDAALADFNAKWPGNAYEHYVQYGFKENVNASNSFDESSYLDEKLAALKADPATSAAWATKTVADLKTAFGNMTALSHYEWYGKAEGLHPVAVPAGERVDVGTTASVYKLTNDVDIATANIFNAPQVYTPGQNNFINSLQNDDELTGTGTNPTLNATLGNPNDNGAALITPILTGIETINARFDSTTANMVLDLQDSTGVKNVNITRIADGMNATVQNIADSTANNLSVTNTMSPATTVTFSYIGNALAADNDNAKVAVQNVNIGRLVTEQKAIVPTEGFESMSLTSAGSPNTIGILQAEDLKTLKIDGNADLTMGAKAVTTNNQLVEATRYVGAFANVSGSLNTVDASALTGKISINLGAEVVAGTDGTSGVPINFKFTGTAGDDTVRLLNGINAGDSIDGGAGKDSFEVYADATGGTVTTTENLRVISGQDAGVAPDAITVNTAIATNLETVYVRNEGQDIIGNWVSAAEGMTVNLTQLTAPVAAAITIAHGTTGNSTISNNILNAQLATYGASDTVGVTIVDAPNVNPVFNFQLGAGGILPTNRVENVTITDKDTESNSVHLINVANHAGTNSTIKITDGAAGQYMNLDIFNNAAVVTAPVVPSNPSPAEVAAARAALGYGTVTDSNTGNATTVLAAADVVAGASINRDLAVGSVFKSTNATVVGGVAIPVVADRIVAENFDASAYNGDIIARFGDVTRVDGVSSMKIASNTGNDTFIFDAQGVRSAGFSSGDSITASTGTDTLVIDGDTTANRLAGGTDVRIELQKSEWDNLKGIDVLRIAGNTGVANRGNNAFVAATGGAYTVEIDNDFVKQTDAGNGLVIVNNDGDLQVNSESDLVLNLRDLAQTSSVTFVGANGFGIAGMSSNRLQVSDNSANSGMVLNGGDTNSFQTTYAAASTSDVLGLAFGNETNANLAWRVATGQESAAAAAATAGNTLTAAQYTQLAGTDGNNNVLEVFNKAEVTINDLSRMSNLGRIEATNVEAVPNALSLTLNSTVMDALVDSSHTASSSQVERLAVVANNNPNVALAVANMNIDATAVSNAFGLDILVGRNTTNNIVGTQGADHVIMLGNYTNAQAAAYTVVGDVGVDNIDDTSDDGVEGFNGANAITTAQLASMNTGIDYRGVDGVAGNADDVLVAYQGHLVSNGGSDVLELFGGVDLSAVPATELAGWTIVAHSSVRMSAAQYAAVSGIQFMGATAHGLSIVNNIDITPEVAPVLTKVTVNGGSLGYTIGTEVPAATGLATLANGGTSPVFNGYADSGTVTPPTPGGSTTINVTAGNTVPYDASITNATFNIAAGNYQYSISNFAAGDKIHLPVAQNSNMSLDQTSFTDGQADIVWAQDPSHIITVHMLGLTSAQDAALGNNIANMNTVFGAGTITFA